MKTFSDNIGVRLFCIKNSMGEYWSNDFGWVEIDGSVDTQSTESHYSVFTEREKQVFNLPIGNGVRWEVL